MIAGAGGRADVARIGQGSAHGGVAAQSEATVAHDPLPCGYKQFQHYKMRCDDVDLRSVKLNEMMKT